MEASLKYKFTISSSSFLISDLIDRFRFNFYFSLDFIPTTLLTMLVKSLFLSSSNFYIESRFYDVSLCYIPNKKLD